LSGASPTRRGPDLLVQAVPGILAKRWDVQFIFAGTGDMRGYLEGAAHGLPVQFPATSLIRSISGS